MNTLETEELLAWITAASNQQVTIYLKDQLRILGDRQLTKKLVSFLVKICQPRQALPDNLERFTHLFDSGIEYFLCNISFDRLQAVILDQSQLPVNCSKINRLYRLALHFPTLRKLGQIVARRQDLPQDVRKWLILLENGTCNLTDIDLEPLLLELQECGIQRSQIPPKRVLAEASVALVLPFYHPNLPNKDVYYGVFKVLKPQIDKKLQEELKIVSQAASYFQSYATGFGLRDMKTETLFYELREDLLRETDLITEQRNLQEAATMYKDRKDVKIPKLFAPCNKKVTTMEFSNGCKVSDVQVSSDKKRQLAEQIFEALICVPLFYHKETAIFHGDPHAGNILVEVNNKEQKVVLIDWTLASHLSRSSRAQIMVLLLGVITKNAKQLGETISEMTLKTTRPSSADKLETIVRAFFCDAPQTKDPLTTSFLLLDELSLSGTVFPAELLLFRKAFFTLEGVLTDLAPGFQIGSFMEHYLIKMLIVEMPKRLLNSYNPTGSSAEHYPSMLSNFDVQLLSWQRAIDFWQRSQQQSSDLLATHLAFNIGLYSALLSPFTIPLATQTSSSRL